MGSLIISFSRLGLRFSAHGFFDSAGFDISCFCNSGLVIWCPSCRNNISDGTSKVSKLCSIRSNVFITNLHQIILFRTKRLYFWSFNKVQKVQSFILIQFNPVQKKKGLQFGRKHTAYRKISAYSSDTGWFLIGRHNRFKCSYFNDESIYF